MPSKADGCLNSYSSVRLSSGRRRDGPMHLQSSRLQQRRPVAFRALDAHVLPDLFSASGRFNA